MPENPLTLTPVDRVTITTVVDNYSDLLLPGSPAIERAPLARDGKIRESTLLAEHGLCLLVTVFREEASHSVLLDTGYTNVAVPHNLAHLGLSLTGLDAVVFSHGHMDHSGALKEVLALTGKGTQVVVHPDVFLPRFLLAPSMPAVSFPAFPSREAIEAWGATVVENKAPLLLADGTVLVTGEIPRVTPFETGMSGAVVRKGEEFVPDTFSDDQALVIHVKDKGLVIISGCAHSGIVNSVRQARVLTGQDKACAVLGGFHLSSADVDTKVIPTIEALKETGLELISPMHCTGFDTIARMAEAFQEAFVLNSVGSRITI